MDTVVTKAKWLGNAFIAALVLLLFIGTPAATANPGGGTGIDPNADTTLTIHKREQPQEYEEPGTGLEDPTVQGQPVPEVTFAVTKVPGIDASTWPGLRAAQALTVPEAAELIAGADPSAEGTTNSSGNVTLDLPVGLYLVDEVAGPAQVVPAAPFLVLLPHPAGDTDGGNQAGWIYDVHVYPKNATASAELAVNDADAVKCGDTVTWASTTSIPHQPVLDQYVVLNILAPGVTLTEGISGVQVQLPQTLRALTPSSDPEEDYTVEMVKVDGKDAIKVTFTESGREKLAAARNANPVAEVEIRYPTRIQAPGSHINEVRLLAGNEGPVADTAETRFGPLKILVYEKGKPERRVEGAVFELYGSQADAATRTDPITVDGHSQFVTDQNGSILVSCLRASNFVDGVEIPPSDPNFRYYYAQPVSYPQGWVGQMTAIAGVVGQTAAAEAVTLEFPVTETEPGTEPGAPEPTPPAPEPPHHGGMPVTGAQVGALLVLAAVLLGGGGMLAYRRRQETEHAETTGA